MPNNNDYSLQPNLPHSSIDYTNLKAALTEAKVELLELEGDMEACNDAKYTNLRRQRTKLVIKIMKIERKLVDKNKSAKKAIAEWNNDGLLSAEGRG